MVKADPKRDYYADLELPSTADSETIKKKFRELAKQYHPDRNPGREVDVVPKFQAIQAAHEILGDANQKAKYDAERARLNKPARDTDSPAPPFKKPPPPRRTDSGYPNGNFSQPASQPPPRRDPTPTRYGPQNGPRRPNSATPSSNDKFAQFARAAPQQRWDQTRFDEAARAEAFRGMNAMRGGGQPQTSPMRSRAHPTAPRSAGNDAYSGAPEPSPGFPGLGRTGSQRRYPPGEEPQSRSAYAQYHRSERERPPSTGPYPHPDPSPQQGPREPNSPLRTTRSFQPDDFRDARPGLSRTTSRPYARTGGERTTLGTGGINRPASVRNSPIDKRWEDETGPFGTQPTPEDRTPRPRHRSHSPPRPGGPKYPFTSDSSSEADESPIPQDRPKINVRKPQGETPNHEPSRPADDGMSGYFPKTNYNSRPVDEHTYAFPAPEVRGTPLRKTSSSINSPTEHTENQDRRRSQEDLPGSVYGNPVSFFPYSPTPGEWPLWAVPSSVCPKTWNRKIPLTCIPEHGAPAEYFFTTHNKSQPTRGSSFTDFGYRNSQSHDAGKGDSRFSAEEWHETLGNQAGMFSPPDPLAKDRKSPTKTSRNARSAPRSYAATKDTRRDAINGDVDPNIIAGVKHVNPDEARDKAAAFQSGRLPDDFVDKVNGQRHGSSSTPSARPESVRIHSERSNGHNLPTPDAMDVDTPTRQSPESTTTSEINVTVEEQQHTPTSPNGTRQHVHRHYSESGGLDLNDLAQSAPFVPADTGLKDLKDLGNNLPFPSRPSETLQRTTSHTLRELNLPRPPKPPQCLTENELDQHTWKRYGDAMTNYMHDWNKFNNAMIEHFRSRQEAVTHGMYRNWVCAQGDGATAENFDASGGSDRAGYATYMTWLEDDRKCRMWWDVAFEEHRLCMEGLGKVRKRVKELNSGTKIT